MQCACGVENAANAKFCKGCGNKLNVEIAEVLENSKSCPACGATLKPDAKFCGKCGHKFEMQATANIDVDSQGEVSEDNAAILENGVNHIVEDAAQTTLETTPISSATQGGNKKPVKIAVIALSVVVAASLLWVGLQKTGSNSASETPTVTASEAPANVPISDTQTIASKYIGKTIKDQTMLDQYSIGLIGKSASFNIFSAYEDDSEGMFSYTKLVLITDQSGKVIDGKDVPQSDRVLVDGKKACVINQTPYAGVYALSTSDNKLSVPAAVWKVNEHGSLVDQDSKGVECGMYVKFMPESDVIEDIVGYNELAKAKPAKEIPAPKKAEIKFVQTQSTSKVQSAQITSKNVVTQSTKPKEPAAEQANESLPPVTQQQESAPQEEPKKESSNSLGGLFQKLGDSVKKGATERTCSAAERSIGQCN